MLATALTTKPPKQNPPKPTFKQSLMGTCTNIIYKLGVIGGLKRMPQLLKLSSEKQNIVVLGEKIQEKSIAKHKISNIIWFTYRKKIQIAQNINSDVGWGCLPRVGQMLLAQAITTYHITKGNKINQSTYTQIITPFLDDPNHQSNYSLNSMLKQANHKFGINPGQWFNIGYLCQILKKIQQENPTPQTKKLQIAFFNQSVIFLNQILSIANIKSCQCYNKKILCRSCNSKQQPSHTYTEHTHIEHQSPSSINQPKSILSSMIPSLQQYNEQNIKDDQPLPLANYFQIIQEPISSELSSSWQIYDSEEQNNMKKTQQESNHTEPDDNQLASSAAKPQSTHIQLENHILLIVSVLISQQKINTQDYKQVLNLLSLPYSLGIIGGVPGKALYIVGFQGDQVIYLDPHYVQQHVDQSTLKQNLHTFFCPQYRKLNRQALYPSLAFCFYLKTIEDIQNLLDTIEETKNKIKKYNRNFFISVMENNQLEEDWQKYQCDNIGSFNNCRQGSKQCSSLQFRDLTDSY